MHIGFSYFTPCLRGFALHLRCRQPRHRVSQHCHTPSPKYGRSRRWLYRAPGGATANGAPLGSTKTLLHWEGSAILWARRRAMLLAAAKFWEFAVCASLVDRKWRRLMKGARCGTFQGTPHSSSESKNRVRENILEEEERDGATFQYWGILGSAHMNTTVGQTGVEETHVPFRYRQLPIDDLKTLADTPMTLNFRFSPAKTEWAYDQKKCKMFLNANHLVSDKLSIKLKLARVYSPTSQ